MSLLHHLTTRLAGVSLAQRASPTLSFTRSIVIPEKHKDPSEAIAPHLLRYDPLLSQFVCLLMRNGEKQHAQSIVSEALVEVQSLTGSNPSEILKDAVELVRPLVQVKSFKRSTKRIMVPFPLTERQSRRKGIIWLIEAAKSEEKKKQEKRFGKRLGLEIVAAKEGKSGALNKKILVHKAALENRSNTNIRVGV
jgi:ribosomal protein S7